MFSENWSLYPLLYLFTDVREAPIFYIYLLISWLSAVFQLRWTHTQNSTKFLFLFVFLLLKLHFFKFAPSESSPLKKSLIKICWFTFPCNWHRPNSYHGLGLGLIIKIAPAPLVRDPVKIDLKDPLGCPEVGFLVSHTQKKMDLI